MAIERCESASGASLYRVGYRTPDSTPTQKSGFRTKRDAEAFANSVEVSKLKGGYVCPADARIAVDELGPAWLERPRGHLKPSAYRRRRSRGGCACNRGGDTSLSVTSGCAEGAAAVGAAARLVQRVSRRHRHPREITRRLVVSNHPFP
jgi:hypothetical protein